MPKIPDCDRCLLYAKSPYLICAVHPTGADRELCPDFELDPQAELEELWEPEGASYYNGELILQPERRLTLQQRWVLLDWHPAFTGRCPQCEMPLPHVNLAGGNWSCRGCGWIDELES